MVNLRQIKARLDYANQAIETGQEQDIPIKMLVCDVQDLLNLLQPRSPDDPPDSDRDVLCLTGYKFPGAELRWRVSCYTTYWRCGSNSIHAWRELPPGAYTEKT